jgi:hypothetical protein
MGEDAMYKIPEIEFSSRFVLKLAQLGFFASFVYWTVSQADGADAADYFMGAMLGAGGLALFLSVPNARLAVTFGLPIIVGVTMIATGNSDEAMWALIMVPMFGIPAYLPDMAMGEQSLGLDDETLSQRTGIFYILFALFFIFLMMGITDIALDGEFYEDEGEESITYEVESTEQTLSQIALAMAVIGIVGFAMTAMMGMELGPARPWHFGALLAGCMVIGSYVFEVTMTGGITENPEEMLWALSIGGIFTLVPCIAYEGSDS